MARPRTPENVLRFIFEEIVKGTKSKEVVTLVHDHFDKYLISASLVADMRNGWAHTGLGAEYGIAGKTKKAPEPVADLLEDPEN